MLFLLFLVLNVALYVRPEELVGEIFGGQLYLVTMCCILPLAAGRIFSRLANLKNDPVSCCVLAFYLTSVVSGVKAGFSNSAIAAIGFGKVVVTYFVALAVLQTPRNFFRYLVALPLLVAGVAGIGLLQYHGVIDNPAIPQCREAEWNDQGEVVDSYTRLCSSGLFNDPNDLCLVLAVGLALCLFHLLERVNRLGTMLSLGLIPMFLYAFVLTKSRGGMLAIAATLASLFVSRFGAKWGAPLTVFGVVGLAALSAGRQVSMDASKGTAQGRIQFWAEGIEQWKSSPVIGIGYGQFAEVVGMVAHNSYVHAYVEDGYLGGTAYVCIFACLVIGLAKAPTIEHFEDLSPAEHGAIRARPYVLAGLFGYCVGMYTLSRNYVIPTYFMAAMANSCLWISHPPSERDWFRMDAAMLRRIMVLGVVLLAAIIAFVKVFVRYE